MNTTRAIVEHVSRLLRVYEHEAVECLESLSGLLKLRVEEEQGDHTFHNKDGRGEDVHHDGNDNYHSSTMLNDSLSTAGNIESIVLQTLSLEHQQHLDDDTNSEALVQAGLNVLRYWSMLSSFKEEKPCEDQAITVDTLCELMTRYPHNELIQEAACVRLSNHSSSLIPPIPTEVVVDDATLASTTTNNNRNNNNTSTLVQRVFFPILQGMNWHKSNPILLNAGMIVLVRLLIKSSSCASDLTERQSQAMALIEMTGGLAIFFGALSQKAQSSANKVIQTDLKVNVCRAILALVLNHPDNQALIAHHAGLSTILDTMKVYSFHLPLQQSILPLLASLAYGVDSKPILLAKGGLDCILTCMKDHDMDPSIQATGCRAIANLFAGTSTDIRVKGSLCVKPALRALRMHPPQLDDEEYDYSNNTHNNEENDDDDDDNDDNQVISNVQIHFYGCAALRNLSKVHARAVVDAGGIATLLITLKVYHNRPAIQEQAWGAMYFLLKTGTPEDCYATVMEGGLDSLLQTMSDFAKHPRIQTVCLGCLAFLSAAHHVSVTEPILSGRTVDLVLSSLHRYHKRGPSDLLQHGCRLLTNIATDYPDVQLPLIVKNGVNVLMMILQHARKDEQVQLEACRVICQLCRDHDNLLQLTEMTSNGASLSTLLGILSDKPKNLDLIACAVEILAHLSTVASFQKDLLLRNRLEVVLKIVKRRQAEESILQVGIMLFASLSTDHDATLWMKKHDMVFWLQGVHMTLPRRSPLRADVQELIDHLRTTRVFLAKFASITGRRK